jgi:hypothetical protein
MRLRLTAHAVARLPRDPVALEAARGALDRRATVLVAWYEQLALLLERPHRTAVLVPDPPVFGPDTVVHSSSGSHYAVWLCEDLDHLAAHVGELVPPAVRIAELRRAPWWR